MLILSRRPGDAILIDGGIRIVVLAVDGGSVRLGIEAPSSVGIVREEILTRIAEENRRAGATAETKTWIKGLEPRAAARAGRDPESADDGEGGPAGPRPDQPPA